ncbi:hypothetical protein GW17_00061044 [Ensete ventricosum]|nr:hypothetical protein GW17_00061044 [Ensete ventricosum]
MPPVAKPQGAAARGVPARRAAASNHPTRGCRLSRGNGGGSVEGGKERARPSFYEKDDPAPLNFKNFEDCPHPAFFSFIVGAAYL